MNCPHCNKPSFDGKHCRFCGCRAVENPVSGNIVYMIRGRVVAAPADLQEQLAKMHARYGISGPDPIDSTGNPVKEEPDADQ